MPLGLSLAFHPFPIQVYGELVPSLLVFPALAGGVGGTVGVRGYI